MRILIAEDERMFRHLLEKTLRGWGYEVVTACDGAEAWEMLQEDDAPRLAILDWNMPGLDGVDVCRRVRATESTEFTHIILLTARADNDDLLEGLAAGANDYLMKPFDPAELKARLQAESRMVEIRSAMIAELAKRKRAEQVMRVNGERFRSLIENSSDAIALFNIDGSILYASPSTARVLGYTPEEFVTLNALEIIHASDRNLVHSCLKTALRQPRVGVNVQARVHHKDGRLRWMEGTFTNLIDDPNVGALVNNYRDITERVEAEEALKESEEQLRTAQKLEAIGRLASGIAHDFNNLLTVINGYSELLVRNLEDSHLRQKIGEIQKAGGRAASLTRQLLAFSRKQVLQPKTLDLNSVVNNFASMLRRLIGENIELVLSLDADLGAVEADPGQLDQVLMNLVVNARDAMPHGGKLVIETTNRELNGEYVTQSGAVAPGSYVMLAVSDDGQGMSAETQKRIFEPFFTTKEQGKGTGLGLSTVYGIIKQSDGTIWVYSEPGVGTTFKIFLPRLNKASRHVAENVAARAQTNGNETILLVEDELVVRNIARETLELSGYKVLEAANAAEALDISEPYREKIDLLLTDVVMPGLSGRELAERLVSTRPETKVLYMSGYTGDAIVQHGVLEEATMFLEKPFAPEALALKVRGVLGVRPA
jgi:two-component system, cell cycle sensor histidine kinase and response regulator CckA